jgi:hypothetical protein
MSGTRPALRMPLWGAQRLPTSFDPLRCGSCCHVRLADLLQLAHSERAKVLALLSIHLSMALQPLPGLGLPHKTPPFISIRGSSPPSSYPQQL